MDLHLHERDAHLAQLEEHRRLAAAGKGRVVLVGGEAGVGKTALVEAFAQRAAESAGVMRISCDALSTPSPLGPARDLAPILGLPVELLAADGGDRDRFFRAMLDAFAAWPDPAVVIAEDAHWSDGASLELLRFLTRRIDGLRLLVVVTYRDDEIGPDHPLRLTLGDLATSPTVHRLGLLPLSQAAVAQMAAPSGRDPIALHRLTGGNPFFLTEVLSADGETTPSTVVDAVLARAARLSPEARAVLDVAAVIGSPIDLDLLLAVAGPVLDEIDACVAGGLVRGTDGGLAFRHELVREAIVSTITPPRLRLLHARVLAALRESPEALPDAARLAHHADAAGDRVAVREFAVAAAEQAVAAYAHHEAAAQYARALRFADCLPDAERARLYEGRSVACHLCGQGAEALAARQAALEIWRSLGDPLREGDSLRWLSRLYWHDGNGAEAESAAIAALGRLEPLPPGPELAMAYSNLAQLRMLASDYDGTILWGERAIVLAESLGEIETLVHALNNVGTARAHVGDTRGEEELRRSLGLALDHGFADHAGRAMLNLAWEALQSMRLDAALQWLAAGLNHSTEYDLDHHRSYQLATRALVRARQGELSAAEADARQVLRQPGLPHVTRIVALSALGRACARRGDPAAEAVLDEALALAERTGQLQRLEPVRGARAEFALLANDPAQARTEVLAIRDLVSERGNRWQRSEFAWLLWQAGERELPEGLDDLAAPYASQIAGDFTAAAAAWRELACPYEEARALAESTNPADVWRAIATFDALGATPALGQAIQRLRALGVRDAPAMKRGPRASTRANPAGLTRREVEVLALMAEGLRNAEIAERLYLTPKTVRHHVSSILGKLGVETRTEAARAAIRLGITAP
jgi:DNA-binding CsgD family transcriptional regulator